MTFAALATTISSLCLPWIMVSTIIPILCNLCNIDDFIVDHYLPELKKSIKGVKLSSH
jgi:hypothetical protein